MLLEEFGIESYGIDISSNAVNQAKDLARNLGSNARFSVYDGEHIPFEDLFFDITLSEGVIDSLPFELAKDLVVEIERVTKKYFYLSLIGNESVSLFEDTAISSHEVEVRDSHECGTIQSFYDMEKIKQLFKRTKWNLKWGEKHEYKNVINNTIHSRYYLVMEK